VPTVAKYESLNLLGPSVPEIGLPRDCFSFFKLKDKCTLYYKLQKFLRKSEDDAKKSGGGNVNNGVRCLLISCIMRFRVRRQG